MKKIVMLKKIRRLKKIGRFSGVARGGRGGGNCPRAPDLWGAKRREKNDQKIIKRKKKSIIIEVEKKYSQLFLLYC